MFVSKSTKKRRVMADTEVAPEATELLFEAEDVAQLAAEITGEDVEVTVDDSGDSVTFTIGDDDYIVDAEGDEEILEASTRVLKGKKKVSASTNRRQPARSKTVRKVASSRK